MTSVIHIRDSQKSDNYVYIGRPGKGNTGYWGNPIAVGKRCYICNNTHNSGGETLECYSQYLESRLANDQEFNNSFFQLKDKTLFCFCRPKDGFNKRVVCHGQIMAAKLDNIFPEDIP